jgi:hypothetical protein
LGKMKPTNHEILKALAKRTRDQDRPVRLEAIKAISKIKRSEPDFAAKVQSIKAKAQSMKKESPGVPKDQNKSHN